MSVVKKKRTIAAMEEQIRQLYDMLGTLRNQIAVITKTGARMQSEIRKGSQQIDDVLAGQGKTEDYTELERRIEGAYDHIGQVARRYMRLDKRLDTHIKEPDECEHTEDIERGKLEDFIKKFDFLPGFWDHTEDVAFVGPLRIYWDEDRWVDVSYTQDITSTGDIVRLLEKAWREKGDA